MIADSADDDVTESMLEPDAKAKLAATVRDLRARLLKDLHDQADGRYRLGVPVDRAGLSEEDRTKRLRLEAWLDEQAATDRRKKEPLENARVRHRLAAEKLAAATLLNRLVVVKILEARDRILPHVVTGGWTSAGYRDFREFAAELVRDDPTEGYAALLDLVFDELALDLPGLFGKVELAELFPPSPVMLRRLVEALDQPELRSAWTDDTTLGWIYQYWNDPEREALDAKLNAGGKVEPHEIASKTQMFTERYMVEWLLHNSLGQIWLAMCRKHGWTPAVVKNGTLDALEARRAEWRKKREAGEVALDALMPIHGGLEERWKYWVPQPMPENAVEAAPERLEDLRILDPACGSGHFLVIAFDLLHELYQEEARHRGERVDHTAIAEKILEHNLHGIDIDPRAVQIAAAALLLTAWQNAPDARPRRLNLVASNLKLGSLAQDDPALVELRCVVREETRLPEELTDRIVGALAGADHLGSLLKVGKEVRGAIEEFVEKRREEVERSRQAKLFEDEVVVEEIEVDVEMLMEALLARLETFLADHTGGDDLGLRLHGEQLTAGMRFVRLLREDSYNLVVANPPYQGTNRMVDASYIKKHYPRGKADLYAAFLERGLELAKTGGMSSMLTMRNWLFISQFTELREFVLSTYDLRLIGDVDRGAFDEVPNELLAAAMSVVRKTPPHSKEGVAMQPTPFDDLSYDRQRTRRKRAAVLSHVGLFRFRVGHFNVVPNSPVLYWWSDNEFRQYKEAELLDSCATISQGISTGNDVRFILRPWEIPLNLIWYSRPHRLEDVIERCQRARFVPLIKGALYDHWIEPLSFIARWYPSALQVRLLPGSAFRSPDTHFQIGVACTAIGQSLRARMHRYHSICQNMGTSVFSRNNESILTLLNSQKIRRIIGSLNPGLHFEVGDLKRLPVFSISESGELYTLWLHCKNLA